MGDKYDERLANALALIQTSEGILTQISLNNGSHGPFFSLATALINTQARSCIAPKKMKVRELPRFALCAKFGAGRALGEAIAVGSLARVDKVKGGLGIKALQKKFTRRNSSIVSV